MNKYGPLFGYFPQAHRSWLVVKKLHEPEAEREFHDVKINITTDGKRHLGAVIGNEQFREKYCKDKVSQWKQELEILTQIALTEPQAVYCAYVSGYKHKFTYFIRTIKQMDKYTQPIDDVIQSKLIPAITGGHICSDDERKLLSLPCRYGGLGIPILKEVAPVEFENSIQMTKVLTNQILGKELVDGDSQSKIKTKIQKAREESHKIKLEQLRTKMTPEQQKTNELNQKPGSYNWLISLPLKEHNYNLNKQQFWDALRIRYNWALPRLPTTCVCGSSYNLQHSLSCKKGGLISLRHNEIRDVSAELMSEVCKDVRKEPGLLPLTGEQLKTSANSSNEARLDISARDFWIPYQRAFFDIRVFDPYAQRYRTQNVDKMFQTNEKEKKRMYNERVCK